MQAVFATRDVILRSDGRIRYLRLTTRTQIIAVVVLTVIGFSAVAASIGMGVQQLSITSEPPGATLRVDGDLVGVTPWAGELAPGPHRVRLEHGGHEPREAELTLAAEHAGDLHVSLPALPVAPVEQPSAWTRIQPLTWGMLGVGAGALVGGLAFELSRASSSERASGSFAFSG